MLFLIDAWFFGQEACGILASRPGIEPGPAAVGGEVLTNRLPGTSLQRILKVIPLFIYLILIAPGSPSRRTGFSPPCISHFEAPHFRAWVQEPVCPLAVARVPTSCSTRGSVALRHVGSSQTRNRTLWPLHQQDSYLLHHQLILTFALSRWLDNQTEAIGRLQCDPRHGLKRSLFVSEALRRAAGLI